MHCVVIFLCSRYKTEGYTACSAIFVSQWHLATTVGVLFDHLLPAGAAAFVKVQGMRQLTKVNSTSSQFGNIYTAAVALEERQPWYLL